MFQFFFVSYFVKESDKNNFFFWFFSKILYEIRHLVLVLHLVLVGIFVLLLVALFLVCSVSPHQRDDLFRLWSTNFSYLFIRLWLCTLHLLHKLGKVKNHWLFKNSFLSMLFLVENIFSFKLFTSEIILWIQTDCVSFCSRFWASSACCCCGTFCSCCLGGCSLSLSFCSVAMICRSIATNGPRSAIGSAEKSMCVTAWRCSLVRTVCVPNIPGQRSMFAFGSRWYAPRKSCPIAWFFSYT